MAQQIRNTESPQESSGCLAIIARLFWMMIGNIAFLFLAAIILQRKSFSALDISYWLVVVTMIVVRFIDIIQLRGLTSDGEPATLTHWRRYALLLLLISAGVWGLAHLL